MGIKIKPPLFRRNENTDYKVLQDFEIPSTFAA